MTPPTAFTHRQILVVLVGVMIGVFLSALDQTIVATALPRIAAEFHGVDQLSWVVAAYLLALTASTPIYGKLSDLYGQRRLMITAIAIFLVASALCALAQTMTQLILARALQGIGGGGLMTLAQAAIGAVISPRERGRYQGYISGVYATASLLGPVVGGLIVEHLSWRWVFWVNLPIGLVGMLLCARALRSLPTRQGPVSIDYIGSATLVAAVVLMMLVTTWGGSVLAWASPTLLLMVGGALVLLVAFGWWERRAPDPVMPLRLFANRTFVTGNAVCFLVSMAMLGTVTFLPLYLRLVHGVSASQAGLLLVPLTLGMVLGSFVSGRRMAATGRYKWFPVVGVAAAGLGLTALATVGGALGPAVQIPLMAITGLGFGTTFPVITVSVQNAVAPRDLGTATSAVTFFRSMGGAFGVAALGAVLAAGFAQHLGQAIPAGMSAPEFLRRLIEAGPAALDRLAPAGRAQVVDGLARSFDAVFLVAGLITVLAFVAAIAVREIPLKTSAAVQRAAE